MLQIGNIVNIFSKLLLIRDCAPATMRTLFSHSESTFAMIKPVSPSKHGKIIAFIMKRGFRIIRMKNAKIKKEFAMDLYRHLSGSSVFPVIIDYMTSGEVIGLELVAPDAVKGWRRALGATDPADAAPGTLRKLYGENILRNIAHGVNSRREAIDALEAFFGEENGKPRIPFRATFNNCTCCVIKSHAIIEGNVGSIIEHIATSEKFYVSAMAMFSLNIANAKEFCEVYNGVLPTYEEGLYVCVGAHIEMRVVTCRLQPADLRTRSFAQSPGVTVRGGHAHRNRSGYNQFLDDSKAMCIHLAEGKCIALEVKCKDPSVNVVCEFRKLCGPRDPDLCRQLYPDSIRALYGKTLVQNAVHCTDLPEDGEMEVEYFFKFLTIDR